MGTTEKAGSVKLTKARVEAIKPAETVVRVFDALVQGFHLRVTPAGTKSYALTFQRPDGRKVHLTIGDAGTWTAEAAREKARELRAIHDEGGDARAYLQGQRGAKDIEGLVKLWRTEGYRDSLKPSSRRSYDSICKCIILPALGNRLIKDLDFPTVRALHRKESKENPIGANRMITVLSRLMNVAEDEGLRTRGTNPCVRFPKTKERPCKRILTAPELGRLEASMHSLEAAGKLDQIAADMIRFLACSGLRAGEASNLLWKDVDLDHGTMTIRDHKTDATMGPKVLPLNQPLRAILSRRALDRLDRLVFPGLKLGKPDKDGKKHLGPIQGLRNMWLRILKVEGCGLGDATPHDLRRTFMSVSVELGYPPAIGDTLLGHSLGKIQDTYTRLSMDGILRNASEDTAAWIAAALRGENPKSGQKVTPAEAKQA